MSPTPLAAAASSRALPLSAEVAAACLADLPVGTWGTVVRLAPTLAEAERSHLMEMGLVPGTRIGRLAVGRARGPLVVALRGALMSLGRAEALSVEVVPQPLRP